jgi:hypothetical protein
VRMGQEAIADLVALASSVKGSASAGTVLL